MKMARCSSSARGLANGHLRAIQVLTGLLIVCRRRVEGEPDADERGGDGGELNRVYPVSRCRPGSRLLVAADPEQVVVRSFWPEP